LWVLCLSLAGTYTAVAAVPGTQLVLDTNMLMFTNTSPTAPRAAALFELPSMATGDVNTHLFDGKCSDMLPDHDGPDCVLILIVHCSFSGDGSLSTARCKQMAKMPQLRGKPGRSVLLTWAVMRFLAPRTVCSCCPLVFRWVVVFCWVHMWCGLSCH
jgi:hypothetical protein